MTPQTTHMTDSELLQELDARNSNGILVRLLWNRQEDAVIVSVDDSRTGDTFSVSVEQGQKPLDVFHHPYAYVR